LRLRLLKQQAQAGDITLLFGDDSEALTHSYLARASAKRGRDLWVDVPGQSRKRAMIGALDSTRSTGHARAAPTNPSSSCSTTAPSISAKPRGPSLPRAIDWLSKYAPELNDIERSWRDLKRHFLAHQTFADIDDLDRAIHQGIADMNRERQSRLCTNLRIAA